MYTWTVTNVPIRPFDDNQPEIDSVQREQFNREKNSPAGRSITRSCHTRWWFDLRQCLSLSSRRSRWKICSRTKRITDDVENEMSALMNLDVDQKLTKRELKMDSASLNNDADQADLM
uniref:(northern house mosquito) hypothetical protein n=1 Tax=Culex pipiens TaxID=7175 RepID=A0A8D8FC10_CULPI